MKLPLSCSLGVAPAVIAKFVTNDLSVPKKKKKKNTKKPPFESSCGKPATIVLLCCVVVLILGSDGLVCFPDWEEKKMEVNK
jgi:hypothetical protein